MVDYGLLYIEIFSVIIVGIVFTLFLIQNNKRKNITITVPPIVVEQNVLSKVIKCWNCNKQYLNYRKVCPYCKQKPANTICIYCNTEFAYTPNPYGVKQINCPKCGKSRIISGELHE